MAGNGHSACTFRFCHWLDNGPIYHASLHLRVVLQSEHTHTTTHFTCLTSRPFSSLHWPVHIPRGHEEEVSLAQKDALRRLIQPLLILRIRKAKLHCSHMMKHVMMGGMRIYYGGRWCEGKWGGRRAAGDSPEPSWQDETTNTYNNNIIIINSNAHKTVQIDTEYTSVV